MGYALTALTVAACGKQAPTPEFHRIQASQPDESGWSLAESTNGNFSVRLPIPFQDFSVSEDSPDSETLVADTVGGTSAEGIKFSATKITYRLPGGAARRFEMVKNGLSFASENVTLTKFGDNDAANIECRSSTSGASMRAVLIGEHLFMLIVEWPAAEQKLAKRLAPVFLDSLRVGE